MSKIRVQDATKELSTNAGRMLENVSRLRKQSQDVLSSLRKISDGIAKDVRDREEREAREKLQKQYEAAAQFMNAYSSEQAPEIPPEKKPEVKAEPAPEAKKAENVAPVANEAPKSAPVKAEEPKQERPAAKAKEEPAAGEQRPQ